MLSTSAAGDDANGTRTAASAVFLASRSGWCVRRIAFASLRIAATHLFAASRSATLCQQFGEMAAADP